MPEAGSLTAIALGLLYFALLATVGLATGLGALSLLRYPADPVRRLLLAPFAATVFWALAGNLLVRFGFTLAQAAPGIGVASLALAVLAVPSFRRDLRLGPLALLTSLGLVAGLLIWPSVVRGLTAHLGSANLDTFHYTSVAATLWRYGLDPASAPLPFFLRYSESARTLGEARNHAFVLLALFSPIVQSGEPLFARNLFVCWSLFVLACNLAFYRLAWGGPNERPEASTSRVLIYVVLTAGVGWAFVPALVGNWDNALLVSVGPVLAGLAREPVARPGYGVFLGVTVAYALYSYTELAPLVGLIVLPLYLQSLWTVSVRKPLLAAQALALVSAGVLLAPGLAKLGSNFRHQVLASRMVDGVKPGGFFAGGLVSLPGDLSGWWALGAEHGARPEEAWPRLCGWLLTGLVVLGVLRLARRGCWGELGSVTLMGASLVYFVGVQRYGYAGYKILSVTWWLVGRCLAEGCAGVLAAARAGSNVTVLGRLRAGAIGGALVAVLVACLFVAERHRSEAFSPDWLFRAQPTLAALARLRLAADSQPPMDLAVGPEFGDHVTLPWVYYAFKDSKLHLYHAAAIPVPGGVAWKPEGPLVSAVLLRSANHQGTRHRFRTPEFTLVDLESTAVIARIDNPNQLEAWGTWLGTEPIVLTLLAQRPLPVTLSFQAAPGPSRPETPRRTLVLRAGSRELARVEIDGPAGVALPFVTGAGWEVLTLSTPDTPSLTVMPNGDTRPLLVSVQALALVPAGPGP